MKDTRSYTHTRYAAHRVQDALAGIPQDEPQKSRCGIYFELLLSLYDAHQNGGTALVQSTWATLSNFQPDFAFLATWQEKLIHADDLKHLAFPTYLAEKYPIYTKGINLLFGQSGTGKSFVALDIAAEIALHSTVVYIAGEGLAGYSSRWEALKAYRNLQTAKLIFYIEALQLLDTTELNQFIEALENDKPCMVVIDTLARSAVGVEENSAREMGAFIRACDLLKEQLQCAVLIVHHTGVSGRIRGSTSLYAAADSVLALTNNDGIITLRNDFEGHGKNKHRKPEKPRFFRLEPFECNGIESAVLVEQDSDSMSVNLADDLTINQLELLRTLVDFEDGMSPLEIIEATGIAKTTVYRNLKSLTQSDYLTKDDGLYSLTDMGKEAIHDS